MDDHLVARRLSVAGLARAADVRVNVVRVLLHFPGGSLSAAVHCRCAGSGALVEHRTRERASPSRDVESGARKTDGARNARRVH